MFVKQYAFSAVSYYRRLESVNKRNNNKNDNNNFALKLNTHDVRALKQGCLAYKYFLYKTLKRQLLLMATENTNQINSYS